MVQNVNSGYLALVACHAYVVVTFGYHKDIVVSIIITIITNNCSLMPHLWEG